MAENIETVVELKNNVLVAMDEKGKKFVVIPQIIFKGKRSISWKEVEKYLVRYIGKIFAVSETEDLILVDRMFVDEYTGSDYTNKLVGALPKVKANMSQGIPQMIEIATEKRWKEDFDSKHKKETRYPSWTNMSDGQKPASSVDDCNTDNQKKQG